MAASDQTVADRAVTLEQLALLCRTGLNSVRTLGVESTGVAALDAALPGGGWQVGSMIEVMPQTIGIGELSLLMPALARITQGERCVALVSPPYVPLAAALTQHGLKLERLLIIHADKSADALWACEQTMRCKSFGAVVAWPVNWSGVIKDKEIRKLQLAAEAGQSIGFLYRAPAAAIEASPAATRLRLQPDADGSIRIDILKCRGGRGGVAVQWNPSVKEAAFSPTINAVAAFN